LAGELERHGTWGPFNIFFNIEVLLFRIFLLLPRLNTSVGEIVVYWYSFSNLCIMCIHCGFSLVGKM